ncbi:glycosyltransferase family 4 protein [Arthrobacter humicola]|uniref:glycosyltransferase family 4 protein n=1 Tax=Arthrobacter humicola TaxID=409291 RepID=UPI001FACECC5|nr:glycosyltransferase [Arthrobacter humicola]MCI9871135.1 glycosyltransferase [Arthrobacter humicola]
MFLPKLNSTRARLYESLRTAHLERARQLEPAVILYRQKRYDFDEQLTQGLHLVHANRLKAAFLLGRSRVRQLEINEPLMLSSLPATFLALVAVRLAGAVRGHRTRIVTYAIGNADPFAGPGGQGWKSRTRKMVERRLALYVWRHVDRVAFGTLAAQEVYRDVLPRLQEGQEECLVPALPAPCECNPNYPKVPARVVYLGDLSRRKGFPLVLAAWSRVVQQDPGAALVILGKGAMVAEAESAGTSNSSVEVHIDPSRDEIHRVLRQAQVLVLPSQSTATWREQVGLPIVEGLAHGCSIVTTTETGLSDWLADNGHAVVSPHATAQELADVICKAIASGPFGNDVTASLPDSDGRLAADEWLFEASPDVTR